MRLILKYRGTCALGIKSFQSQALRAAAVTPGFPGPGWAMLPPRKRGKTMQILIEKMLNDFERGTLSRRQLAATLTGMAAAVAVPATLATPALAAPSLRAITLNHVTVRVP